VRRLDQHLVTRLQEYREGVGQGLLGTVGDDDLVRPVGAAPGVGQAGGDGLPQGRDPGDGRVAGEPVVDRLVAAAARLVGGREVHLAAGEVDDVDPLGGELLDVRVQRGGARRWQEHRAVVQHVLSYLALSV
jgi:hypothetical protein